MPFDKSVIVPLDPDATFDLVTQPDRLRRWLTIAARVDMRAGGGYRWTVTPGHHAAGSIVDVDPGKHVTFTFGWEEDADLPPGASTVTVTLTPVDGGTEVRLVHDGLTDDQAVQHAEGWNHFLGRLVAAGHDGDAGPDEWVASPDQLDELSCAEATLAVLQQGGPLGAAVPTPIDGFLKPEPFTPGKVEKVEFELPDVYHAFRRGHRVMIHVQSSWFPLVDRNPQKFLKISEARAEDFQKATQRVYRSGNNASGMQLLVIE